MAGQLLAYSGERENDRVPKGGRSEAPYYSGYGVEMGTDTHTNRGG
jgi:hypothetical protein